MERDDALSFCPPILIHGEPRLRVTISIQRDEQNIAHILEHTIELSRLHIGDTHGRLRLGQGGERCLQLLAQQIARLTLPSILLHHDHHLVRPSRSTSEGGGKRLHPVAGDEPETTQ